MSDRGPALTDDDLTILVTMGPAIAVVLAPWVVGHVEVVREWLLEHHLLVDAADAVLALPGAGGAGLDTLRVAALAAMMLVAVTGIVLAVLRRRRRAREASFRMGP